MANDAVGVMKVGLGECTLCDLATRFDGTTRGRSAFDFGLSGLLYNSNKFMHDRHMLIDALTNRLQALGFRRRAESDQSV
jgi:hypothetical protein